MKLYTTAGSPYARKVRIVLEEKSIDCELIMLKGLSAPDSPLLAVNPLGKVPALQLDDGTALYDSPVICDYLDETFPTGKLIPAMCRIETKRWEALADGVCDATVAVVMEGRRALEKQDVDVVARQTGKVERGLKTLAADFADKQWCLNNAMSLADIALGCTLGYLDLRMPDLGWQKKYPNLAGLYERLMQRPAFQNTKPPA